MNLDYRYSTRSALTEDAGGARLGFSTNLLRETTFFSGQLATPLLAREGFAALYDVVVSDFKWRPKERLAYRLWLETQDREFVASFGARSLVAKEQLGQLHQRLRELDASRQFRRKDFTAARVRYMSFAARDEMEAYRVLDPVITVHPDELSFEAFSRDQSSYARLRLSYENFSEIDGFECGTTNIDFSHALHLHLDRLRSYRQTRFEIGAGGFASAKLPNAEASTGANEVFEKRIALPEGWIEGFLNVHGLISMGLTRLQLAPVDVLNVLKFLMAHKTKISPRALRFELSPGLPIRIVLEPWNVSFWCSPLSVYQGAQAQSIRIWGRDRLRSLLRVLPVTDAVDVYLAGTGLPSVWVCHLGLGIDVDCAAKAAQVSFTLALSGWTDNDWVEGDGKFDLLNKRLEVSAADLDSVYQMLRTLKRAPYEDLAARTGLATEKVKSAVSVLAQSGRAMFDLREGVPRHRDLLLEPFSATKAVRLSAQIEAKDPRAALAKALHAAGQIVMIARRPVDDAYKLSGNCALNLQQQARVRPQLHIANTGEIIAASCTCEAMTRDGLSKGPCEHVLALRLAHRARLEQEHV